MKDHHIHGIIILIIIIFVVIFPFAYVYLTVPSEPFHILGGEPVKEAAANANIDICSVSEVGWNVPGATVGKTYIISENCDDIASSPSATIMIQGFENEEARDGAVHRFNTMTIGKTRVPGRILVIGDSIVYVKPDNPDLASRIQAELVKKKSAL